jgi:serine/alanine racemase
LGATPVFQLELLRRYHLTQTVVDHAYAMQLKSFGKPLYVHIKLDTGMRRMGERAENTERLLELFACKNLRVTGIFTHLGACDSARDEDVAFSRAQLARFYETLETLGQRGIPRPKIHIQSSYGVLNYPELRCDFARVGIALFGAANPSLVFTENREIDWRAVLSVKARIALIRDVAAGESVGYSRAFIAPRDMRVAVVSAGYADGVPRALSGSGAWVAVRGARAPIVGNICMDVLLADVTEIADAAPDDIAVIMGGAAAMSVLDVSSLAETIPNEILSRLGRRLERKYIRKELERAPEPPVLAPPDVSAEPVEMR